MKLDKSQEICKIVETKSDGSIVGTTTIYFEKLQDLQKGIVKGLLTIHDPNYLIHGKRVRCSPYTELEHSAFLQCLVNLSNDTYSIFEHQKNEEKSKACANYLISAFLEKMKPVEIEN